LESMKEIRIHGRGGHGVVLGSEIFVSALIKEGKFASCFPFFGVERRGAPVFGFVRFDERPVRQKDQVYYPDCVVVMDGTLFKAVNIYQGVKENSTLVVNESRSIEELTIPANVHRVGLVDATRISLEKIKTFIPNTAMLGALCRTTGWVSLGSLVKSVSESFDRKIRQKNIEMLERAYEETKIFERGEDGKWR
jgi:2-oxoacid:acceptor oxidoreductase gamma subunit (pyruvate/2-ketoisovalerate family)